MHWTAQGTCLVLGGQALRDRCVPRGCRQARRRGDRLEHAHHRSLLHRAVRHPEAIALLLQGQHGGDVKDVLLPALQAAMLPHRIEDTVVGTVSL